MFASNVTSGPKKDFLNKDVEAILAASLRAFSVRRLHNDFFLDRPVTSLHSPVEHEHILYLSPEAQKTQEATRDLWDPLKRASRIAEQRKRSKAKSDGDPEADSGPRRGKGELFTGIFEARMNTIHPDLLVHGRYGEDIFATDAMSDGVGIPSGQFDPNSSTGQPDVDDVEVLERVQKKYDDMEKLAKEKRKMREHAMRSHAEKREAFRSHLRSKRNGWQSGKTIPILMVLQQCMQEREEGARRTGSEVARKIYLASNKTIISSEWLCVLDLLEVAIQEKLGLQCARYDGTMDSDARNQVISAYEEKGKDFARDPTCQPSDKPILLASVKGCAEGLELPHTKWIHFAAPAWNPSVTDQCKYRALRLTNPNKVVIHHFIMFDSIEKRILDTVVHKRESANGIYSLERLKKKAHKMSKWEMKPTFLDKVRTLNPTRSFAQLTVI